MPGLDITEDRLLGGRLRIRQYKKAYRIAIDPILLAASIDAKSGQRVLDIGCGVGAASLCLAERIKDLHITGLEKEKAFADLARENVKLNGMGGAIHIHRADLKSPMNLHESYDWAMANPPYLARGKASPSPHPLRAAANMEGEVSLKDWIKFAVKAVRREGAIAFIHRWDRSKELAEGFASTGRVKIVPLAAKEGRQPHRVILLVKKGKDRAIETLPVIILHNADGSYTERIENVLRHAAPLDLT